MPVSHKNGVSKGIQTILLVEDNHAHAELIRRCFDDLQSPPAINHVSDGKMAMDYLYGRELYSANGKAPRPYLILLDLRLPKVDGLDVLSAIKSDTQFAAIPVIVLTSSDADNDLAKAYEYHANGYLVKPMDFSKFTELVHRFSAYWLGLNRQPI